MLVLLALLSLVFEIIFRLKSIILSVLILSIIHLTVIEFITIKVLVNINFLIIINPLILFYTQLYNKDIVGQRGYLKEYIEFNKTFNKTIKPSYSNSIDSTYKMLRSFTYDNLAETLLLEYDTKIADCFSQ